MTTVVNFPEYNVIEVMCTKGFQPTLNFLLIECVPCAQRIRYVSPWVDDRRPQCPPVHSHCCSITLQSYNARLTKRGHVTWTCNVDM